MEKFVARFRVHDRAGIVGVVGAPDAPTCTCMHDQDADGDLGSQLEAVDATRRSCDSSAARNSLTRDELAAMTPTQRFIALSKRIRKNQFEQGESESK